MVTGGGNEDGCVKEVRDHVGREEVDFFGGGRALSRQTLSLVPPLIRKAVTKRLDFSRVGSFNQALPKRSSVKR